MQSMTLANPLRTLLTIILSIGLVATLAACEEDVADPLSEDDFNVAERIELTDGLAGFEGALEAAGILDGLRDDEPVTVFASPLADVDTDALAADEAVLSSVLEYHIVDQQVEAGDLSDGDTIETRSGDELEVSVVDGTPLINGAPVTQADLPANNGVVHVIDRTLLENQSIATRVGATNATATLNAAVAEAGEAGPDVTQEGITVFAPANSAFDEFILDPDEDGLLARTDLLADVLNYHVVDNEVFAGDLEDGQTVETLQGEELEVTIEEGDVFINNAQVVTPDLRNTNGVVHLIDAPEGQAFGGVLTEDILTTQDRVEVTVQTGSLAAAAGAAGADLSDEGAQFTVFAPVNDAFAGVDVEDLLEDADLAEKLVEYHVLDQTLTAADLIEGGDTEYATLEETPLSVEVDEEALTVDVEGIPVAVTDIETSNGVIHYLEEAPLQNHLNITERTILANPLANLQTAVEAAELGEALTGDDLTVFAPTNDGFGALDEAVLEDLLENEAGDEGLLADILRYHAVGERLNAEDLADRETVETLQGQDLALSTEVNGNNDGEESLRALLAGKEEHDGNGSVDDLLVNEIPVVGADVRASNGFIHLIDEGVLVPDVNVVAVGILNGFLDLRSALEATDLRETLEEDEVTVFAPPNEAFQAFLDDLGVNSFDRLTADELDELEETLTYHVVEGAFTAEDITDELDDEEDEFTVETEQGTELTFTLDEFGDLQVNGAPVGPADLEGSNGVVHGIDRILEIPENGDE